MFFFWLALTVLCGVPITVIVVIICQYYYLKFKYLRLFLHILQSTPHFIIPRGKPIDDAEEVRFHNDAGLTLCGVYFHASTSERRGVVLFGLEFGSDRWSAVPYCDFLLEAGYDVFAFEPRNQGESDTQLGYDPLIWVTDFEVKDFQSALAYLRGRPDADSRGIGLFGISKGAGAGLIAASGDPSVRCCVTDGAFATHTTIMSYMREWKEIYSHRRLQLIPNWVYGAMFRAALKRIQRERRCRFPHLERRICRLSGRPLLMIHGGKDTFIKPEMASALFSCAGVPKELWVVQGAKLNQARYVAVDEYQRRVLEFFDQNLGHLESRGIKELLHRILQNPTGGVVGLVDDLLVACEKYGLQLDWQAECCRVRSLGGGWEELIDVPLRKAVFRAVLARVAALCNERTPNSVSPYGGQCRFSAPANQLTVFDVTFTNTSTEQKLELVTETVPAAVASHKGLTTSEGMEALG